MFEHDNHLNKKLKNANDTCQDSVYDMLSLELHLCKLFDHCFLWIGINHCYGFGGAKNSVRGQFWYLLTIKSRLLGLQFSIELREHKTECTIGSLLNIDV